jgi:excisionase family DNA binding protein
MMDTFLTVNELADTLKVERRTVIGWIASGRLLAFKPGGGRFWRIRRADFQRFIKGGAEFRQKFNT